MTQLLVALALLLGNAFFVGSEFALIASRRTVVEPQASTSRRARAALRAMGEIPLMIAGAQLGVTVCSLGLGAIAEPALARWLGAPLHVFGVPSGAVHGLALALALVLVVYLHTVVGEMVPKNLTLAGPERAVLWLGPPMLWFCLATRPLLAGMRWANRMVLKMWRIEAVDAVKTVFTAGELANLVTQARAEGLLDPEEHARIQGALKLATRTAGDVMRPWGEVVTIASDATPQQVEELAVRTGRSRFPVVRGPGLRVIGFVHVKDMIGLSEQEHRRPLPAGLVRPLGIVSLRRTLSDLLIAMRRDRRHIVLITDAGAPVGILTLHDLLGSIQRLSA